MKHRLPKRKTQQRLGTAADNAVYINHPNHQEAVANLLQSTWQLHMHVTELSFLIDDKQERNDFSAAEWDKLADCLQQVLYIDHSARRLLHSIK